MWILSYCVSRAFPSPQAIGNRGGPKRSDVIAYRVSSSLASKIPWCISQVARSAFAVRTMFPHCFSLRLCERQDLSMSWLVGANVFQAVCVIQFDRREES